MKHLGLAALALLASTPLAAQTDEPNVSRFNAIGETSREVMGGGGGKRTYEGLLNLSLSDRSTVNVRMTCTAIDTLSQAGISVSCRSQQGQPLVSIEMTCSMQTFARGEDLSGPCGVHVVGALRQLGNFDVRGRTPNRTWTVFELDWANAVTH